MRHFQAPGPFRAAVARIVRAYLPLIVLAVAFYVPLPFLIGDLTTPIGFQLLQIIPNILISGAVALYVVVSVLLVRRALGYRGLGWHGRLDRRVLQGAAWLVLVRAAPVLIYVFVLQRCYLAVKPKIPTLAAFTWDPLFAAWDRALLLGYDAWQVTFAVLPGSVGVAAVEQIYLVWFFAVFGCAVVAAAEPLSSTRRLAFLLAFGLGWSVGGAVLATVFSSAGPVYYQRLFGDPVFAPLIDRLATAEAEMGVSLLTVVETLWLGNLDPPLAPPLGISAFPSMHLCLSATVCCYAYSRGRIWGHSMLLYTILILFGSVHLGWHYLVDGIAGIALGWLFWRLSLGFARRWLAEAR